MERASKLASDLGAVNWVKNEYLWPWMLRVHFFSQTRSSGRGSMELDPGLTPTHLKEMCPDQNSWASELSPHTMRASDLFENAGYDGPPELFTMYACLFMSCEGYDPEWIKQHEVKFMRQRETFQRDHGIPPHPLLLLKGSLD